MMKMIHVNYAWNISGGAKICRLMGELFQSVTTSVIVEEAVYVGWGNPTNNVLCLPETMLFWQTTLNNQVTSSSANPRSAGISGQNPIDIDRKGITGHMKKTDMLNCVQCKQYIAICENSPYTQCIIQ